MQVRRSKNREGPLIIKKFISFFLFFTFFNPLANAGFITIETKITTSSENEILKVIAEVKNNGNEPAYNVEIRTDLQTDIKVSKIKDALGVGETYKADFEFNLNFKNPGKYPLVIAVNYTDANQYPFSALSCTQFAYRENTVSQVFAKSMELAMSKKGELILNAKNLAEKDKNLSIRLIIPKEISADALIKKMSIQGRSEKEIGFNLNNFSALPGSNYQIYAILEYEEGNKHYSTVVPGVVKIEREGMFFQKYKTLIIVIVGILVLLFLVYQFMPKKSPNDD